MTFNIVPTPACCFSGIHNKSTPRLIIKVRAPILRPVVIESPSAKTVHGLIPADAVIIRDSPNPNKIKPKQRMITVRGFGEKFNGFSELHSVVGTDLIENIFITRLS
ncbi:MAG: hypothetical protein ISP95_04105 [SAR86 cluster bacterium]|nr:hypothetical protein [SAR86 cluster bacterium]